ncbi:RNA pseudouridine synthase [Rhodovulum viride]|uniref:Pseudouridine synthase n=1 Tax=Rhodovulum viride TaxID=1231134 RepID=A0ABX9DLG5_9RHOB|nr:pseudouridine synthase [Rhodovulum viride]RAP42514.1 RNA pseudouridine synthase [Rhodovulum viride]
MDKTGQEGERIAKILARAGLASRREAERMIAAGRVTVNGRRISSPALNVTAADRIAVDGAPLAAADRPRLWLYHKPAGLVTTAKDEKDRETVFDKLPEDMPRVMSVGRLDLNSEGLLLLTNDGAIKRRLELPSTGWLRKYRVRVKGTPEDATLAPLREGIVIAGESFRPMEVTLDRQQGANAWLTVGLREGRNREIRRAMEAIGLTVNRLIRISYGPFQLGALKAGEVEEIRGRVLRDQLGLESPEGEATGRAKTLRPRSGSGKPAGPKAPGSKPGGARGTDQKPPGAKPARRTGGRDQEDISAPPPGRKPPRGTGGTGAARPMRRRGKAPPG